MLLLKKQLYLLFLFFSFFSFAQEAPQRLKFFEKEYFRLENANKLDSIAHLISKYEAFSNLKPIENQIIQGYKAMHYNFRGRYEDAKVFALKSLKHKTNEPVSHQFAIYIYAVLSDINFTLKDFNNAKKYASLALSAKLDNNHSTSFINLHNIMGYCYFLEKKYDLSLNEYLIAKQRAVKNQPCKVPEIYCKIARIYSKQGKISIAKKMIDDCIKISDSCKETVTKLNSLKSLREIYVENKLFESAANLNKSIDDLNDDKKNINRNNNIDSLETSFKTKLKAAQNEKLKIINSQKNHQISLQKMLLTITFIGLLLLAILLFIVYKLSRKQKKINKIMELQQKEIQQSNQNLERLNLLNKKIFTVISHDFKGPMLTLELLLKTDFETKIDQITFQNNKDKIRNHLAQANLIMQNLLNWAKTELKMVQLESKESIVFETAEKTIYQLKALIEDKKLTIINTIPKGLKTNMHEDILIIIFRNLINNAIKFSFPENDIIIGFDEKTNEYFVQDFGIGMTNETVESLAKQNVVSKMGTNQETGFGLGLSFVISLLKQNQGIFRIESTFNEGSVFYFSL